MDTCTYLDAVQKKHSIPSDYALAMALGLTRGAISSYRHGRTKLNMDTCLKVAQLLDLHPAVVVSDIAAERAETATERELWAEVSKRFSPPNWSDLHTKKTA